MLFIFNKIKEKKQGWLTFVDVHMSMHLISSCESAPAFLTFVRFLSSMQAHVHLESPWRGERKRADFTHVWPFSSVHAYVGLQATEACKILGAQSALVLLSILDEKILHLFTCKEREHRGEGQSPWCSGIASHVWKHVLLKVAEPRELAVTLLALVWLVVVVDEQMALKITGASEWHHAEVALEWLFFARLFGLFNGRSGITSGRLKGFFQEWSV